MAQLSGSQVCNWGIQYHLCSTYRGLWELVVVWLSKFSGRALASQAKCPHCMQGCFNHRVVTMVADKLKRLVMRSLLWYWRLTTFDNPISSYAVHLTTTIHLHLQYTDNYNTLTTLRTSVKESLQMQLKVAVRNFYALNVSRWGNHSCSEGCQACSVLWLWDELTSCPLLCLMQLVFNTTNQPLSPQFVCN